MTKKNNKQRNLKQNTQKKKQNKNIYKGKKEKIHLSPRNSHHESSPFGLRNWIVSYHI